MFAILYTVPKMKGDEKLWKERDRQTHSFIELCPLPGWSWQEIHSFSMLPSLRSLSFGEEAIRESQKFLKRLAAYCEQIKEGVCTWGECVRCDHFTACCHAFPWFS